MLYTWNRHGGGKIGKKFAPNGYAVRLDIVAGEDAEPIPVYYCDGPDGFVAYADYSGEK